MYQRSTVELNVEFTWYTSAIAAPTGHSVMSAFHCVQVTSLCGQTDVEMALYYHAKQ